ncbi:thymidylate synthase [Kitasatospora albolonga]|uniref:thymidylate synthase n=1 Tax=Kitasatospora albolonga TaxID=68173 RepID=UPI003CD08584
MPAVPAQCRPVPRRPVQPSPATPCSPTWSRSRSASTWGDFIWTGGDCHVYDNHVEQVTEQLSRTAYEFPHLRLRRADSLFDYAFSDVELLDYRHHPAIKAPVAV